MTHAARASGRAARYPQGEVTMARADTMILDSGDRFPRLEMETVKHGRVVLPDAFGAAWGVVLIYRAHW